MPRHLILVGLPGAGKTTVGRLAAQLLRAPFADFDEAIVARDGRPIPRIFAEDGEAAFRAIEAATGADLLAGPPAVLATGGGFLVAPENRQRALQSGLVVYLETSPADAAARLGPTPGRPLLEGGGAVARLEQLLGQRQAAYLEAHERVTTQGLGASAVAARVAELARACAGW